MAHLPRRTGIVRNKRLLNFQISSQSEDLLIESRRVNFLAYT